MKIYFYTTIAILLLPLFLSAQVDPLKFERFELEKGQSQIHILSIFKDSKGFLWIGTYDGAYKYDGIHFTHYRSNIDDNSSLSHTAINSIFEDKDKIMWFGTDNGLNRFDRKTEKFERIFNNPSNPNSISSNYIKQIVQDSKGIIWIATYGGGLNSLDPKTRKIKRFIQNKYTPNAIAYEKLNCLFIDANNNIWVGAENAGLAIFDPVSQLFSEVKIVQNKESKQLIINSIYEDRQGTKWIGTWGDGLIQMDEKKNIKQWIHDPKDANSISINVIRTITEDRLGQIWIGTFSGGISIFNKEEKTFKTLKYQPENDRSISNNIIWQLYADHSGIIWVGTFGSGLNKYDPFTSKFPLFQLQNKNPQNGLNNNAVSSIFEMSNGKFWIGTLGGGLNIYDPTSKHFSQTKLPIDFVKGNIRTIFEDSKKRVWIGTEGGVMRTDLNATKCDFISNVGSKSHSLQNKTIFAITEDKNGAIWIGTWGNGLFKITEEEANKQKLSDMNPISYLFTNPGDLKLDKDIICSLLYDSKNRLWIGTQTGLFQYEETSNRFTFYKTNLKAQKNENNYSVSVIFEDRNKKLWLGSFGQGITPFDPQKTIINYFSEDDGLAGNTVSGITQDKSGSIWVSTLKGLSKLNPENMKVKNYFQVDGLQDNTFNFKAYCSLKNGQLAFGGPNGLNIFEPTTLIENPKIPQIAFTEFRLFNRLVFKNDDSNVLFEPIDESTEIALDHNQYSFSISFTNLLFSQLEKCRYAFKLVGFDKDWIYTDANNPTASYTNLGGGDYTFIVKACNSDGVWNNEGKSLKIKIIPPFWKTIWFLLFISTSLTIFIVYFLRLKLNRVLRFKDIQIKRHVDQFEEEKLRKENMIIQLQKAQLDQEIEHKNKELASYVVGMIQKNEKMTSVRDKIRALLPTANAEMQKKLKLVIGNIEDEIGNDSNWDKFVISFNLIHDDFLKRFAEAFPDMTHNDLRICAYIRMNVPSKEIADLLNVSVRTIESTRFRVRKKINLESETNLNDYILRY